MNEQKLIEFLKWAIAVSHAPAYWVPKAQELLKELADAEKSGVTDPGSGAEQTGARLGSLGSLGSLGRMRSELKND